MNPLTLLEQPEAPVASPEAPAAPPEAPVASPEAPAAPPEAPVASPEAPAIRAKRRLELSGYDLSAALVLRRELGVSHAMAQILVRRGHAEPAAARAFLDAEEEHPARAFAGIERATILIHDHIARGSRIAVHGDYDVDGVCATALLAGALRSLGADVQTFIPSRLDDGYGLATSTVERLAAGGVALLITVDCGITAVEEVAAARRAGMDVIVTDHHQPRADGVLPDAPLVHPALCGYPCPELCGTGVAFKLAEALGAPDLHEQLELVALATVADLMPLRGENRRLVRRGLAELARTGRPGLRALMAVSRCDPSQLDASAIGFRLAPRINAAGRLARADAGLELLLTREEARASEIAAELDALNAERREVEQRILWEADAQVTQQGARSAYVLCAEGWHPGVIGIVASRIVERYHRPTLMIALDEAGVGHGSGRSIPGFDLLGGLHAVAGRLERYGGHAAAAGFSVRAEAIEALRVGFEAHVARTVAAELLEPVERVDAVVDSGACGLSLAEELARLEPCGMGNPGPRLLVPGARFEDIRPMGEGKHARFRVRSGAASVRAVAFGCEGTLGAEPGEAVDAAFRLERNAWNGSVDARLVLRCAHRPAPSPIQVLGEPDEYLAGVQSELLALGGTAGAPGWTADRAQDRPRRVLLDRRGESPLAILRDAIASGGDVLALCADVPRRLPGLAQRSGGYALACHHALERDPDLGIGSTHLVILDPPAAELTCELIGLGEGFTHLAWGEPELGFSKRMLEMEYALRTQLRSLYRSLAEGGRVSGARLVRVLQGEGSHPRPARLSARLIRVLDELGLARFEPGRSEPPSLELVDGSPRTALERSPSFRACAERHEEGMRCLLRAELPVLA